MKAILLGLVQCTNREHGSASNRPTPEHVSGLGGGSSLHTVEESLYFSDNAIVGLSWESVYMGGGVDTPASRPPQGLFIPFERPVFHWGDRRLKPCLSQSLNG